MAPANSIVLNRGRFATVEVTSPTKMTAIGASNGVRLGRIGRSGRLMLTNQPTVRAKSRIRPNVKLEPPSRTAKIMGKSMVTRRTRIAPCQTLPRQSPIPMTPSIRTKGTEGATDIAATVTTIAA